MPPERSSKTPSLGTGRGGLGPEDARQPLRRSQERPGETDRRRGGIQEAARKERAPTIRRMTGYAFHPDALANLDKIWEYIARDNIDAARQTRSRLGVGNLSRTQKSATDGCDPSGPTVDRQYAKPPMFSHTAKSGVPNDGELEPGRPLVASRGRALARGLSGLTLPLTGRHWHRGRELRQLISNGRLRP